MFIEVDEPSFQKQRGWIQSKLPLNILFRSNKYVFPSA